MTTPQNRTSNTQSNSCKPSLQDRHQFFAAKFASVDFKPDHFSAHGHEQNTHFITENFGLNNPGKYGYLEGTRFLDVILFVAEEGVFICNHDYEIAHMLLKTLDDAVEVLKGERMPDGPHRDCGEVYDVNGEDQYLQPGERRRYLKPGEFYRKS
ncbi:hypothetical protein BDD12DRAFT_926861 [Trichophaea hybrida]|nr:hypothetical protein BDD12DRAFT_926861 [Trichophaea hybrida]